MVWVYTFRICPMVPFRMTLANYSLYVTCNYYLKVLLHTAFCLCLCPLTLHHPWKLDQIRLANVPLVEQRLYTRWYIYGVCIVCIVPRRYCSTGFR